MNIPNTLTVFRIILVPVFILTFYMGGAWRYEASVFVFFLASATDWFDGYLARKLNQSTPFGAFLDPVADKLMVAVCLCLLIEELDAWYFTLPSLVIIGREIVISALREWMAEIGDRGSVAVSFVGKAKTMAQMAAIMGFLLAGTDLNDYLSFIGLEIDWVVLCVNIAYGLLFLAAFLTIWSMLMYLKAAWPALRGDAA